jgi:hypothetical protein
MTNQLLSWKPTSDHYAKSCDTAKPLVKKLHSLATFCGVPWARPGTPGAPWARPGTPGAPWARPGVPGAPWARPGVPGAPWARPGVPGAPWARPGGPGSSWPRPSGPGSSWPRPSGPCSPPGYSIVTAPSCLGTHPGYSPGMPKYDTNDFQGLGLRSPGQV